MYKIFLKQIENNIVPDEFDPAYGDKRWGEPFDWKDHMHISHKIKDVCRNLGMYAVIDMKWTKRLAEAIGDNRVLEIMAGRGWLASALERHGVDIIATDDYSWEDIHSNEAVYITKVRKMDALDAVIKINADILLVSWPPYTESYINDVCDQWGTDRPIIYIGEGMGGCTANDEFHRRFIEERIISMPRQSYMHDCCTIGRWSDGDQEESE